MPGAGRPKLPKTIETEKQKAQAAKYKAKLLDAIEKNSDKLVKSLIDRGLTGDIVAIKEMHDRALGRTPQPVVGDDGGDIKISLTIYGTEDIVQPDAGT